MRFTETELQLAARLRGAGLIWAPQAGHYVFDIDGVLKAASPFQASVHLVSSPNAIERQVGGSERLHEQFYWIPTWADATDWLAERGVDRKKIVTALRDAVKEDRSDLEAVYGLILQTLDSGADA